uniref:Outer envelope pore protein 37, chloroplastic n=1 Tax=Kalanchoe fedtschenkoi TaxID=63787 RepID=A0A7N0ZUB3_KALFE
MADGAESTPPNPNHMVPPSSSAELPSPVLQAQPPPPSTISFPRPSIRITNEYDSEGPVFLNKVSCKLFDGLAKLRLSFQNNRLGEVAAPRIGFISKYLTVLYDVEEQDAVVKGSVDLGSRLHLRADHYVKAHEGEVTLTSDLPYPGYKFELSTSIPSGGWPKATFKFPFGEFSLDEKDNEEVKRPLSINGIVKTPLLNGLCIAMFENENLKLRYSYKDEDMSFSPSISLPSNALSFAFKRRFSPSDKMSYFYNLDSNHWSAVYKHSRDADYTFKAGYDSEVKLGWASLWLGDESNKAKSAPMKMKAQLMVQVPQDNIRSPIFMFRVKKRWDV